MNALGKLEQLFLKGKITEEEYKERKTKYVEIILELYIKGLIDKEEIEKRINQ